MTGERLFGRRGQGDDTTADSTPVPPAAADPTSETADPDDRLVVNIRPAAMTPDGAVDHDPSEATTGGAADALASSLWSPRQVDTDRATVSSEASDASGVEVADTASGDVNPANHSAAPTSLTPDAAPLALAAVASDTRRSTSGAIAAMANDPVATEIRRWDDTDTDVMHAVGRRPESLSERHEVDVQVAEDKEPSRGSWYEIPVMLLVAFTLAFLLRTFVVQVFYVPSGSMIPTLEINDRIATEKVTYLFRDLARGDVIVFAGDEPFGANADMSTAQQVATGVGQFVGVVPVDAEDFVKRVIGLEGDTIEIADGVVSVNGVQLDEPYAYLDSSNGVWEVPSGSLFVMGDNRPNSGDSRTALGFIDRDDIVGRAVAKIWPLDRIGSVEGVDWDPIPEPG